MYMQGVLTLPILTQHCCRWALSICIHYKQILECHKRANVEPQGSLWNPSCTMLMYSASCCMYSSTNPKTSLNCSNSVQSLYTDASLMKDLPKQLCWGWFEVLAYVEKYSMCDLIAIVTNIL